MLAPAGDRERSPHREGSYREAPWPGSRSTGGGANCYAFVRLGVAALAILLAAGQEDAAGQSARKLPRIGFLTLAPEPQSSPYFQAFERGLRELGHVAGKTVSLEIRSANRKPERLPALATELVHRDSVDVMVVPSCGRLHIEAVRHASRTVPLVVAICGDLPGFVGEVASFAQPGGYTTGLTFFAPELSAKRLALLKETLPRITNVAVLWNPTEAGLEPYWHELRTTASAMSLTLQSIEVRSPGDLDDALRRLNKQTEAILTLADIIVIFPHRARITEFALQRQLVVVGDGREFATDGALMSYGPNFADMMRKAATYVDKILKGAVPADLPIERPTNLALVVNLRTAKQLRITVPRSLLLRADAVVE